jgi:DNA transposition AAA+ family ATPase
VVLVGTDRLDAVIRRDEQIYQRVIMSHRYERLTSAQLVETSVIWEKHVLRLPEPSQLGSAKMQKVLGLATGGYIGLLDRTSAGSGSAIVATRCETNRVQYSERSGCRMSMSGECDTQGWLLTLLTLLIGTAANIPKIG